MNPLDADHRIECAECGTTLAHAVVYGDERAVGQYAPDTLSFSSWETGASVVFRCPGCSASGEDSS